MSELVWSVYVILCDNGSLYTGISTDVARRFSQHRQQKGAKFFRARKPERLLFVESGHDRSSATKRELAIKRMSRANKLTLIAANGNESNLTSL